MKVSATPPAFPAERPAKTAPPAAPSLSAAGLSASLEDYLEAIYHIASEKGASRAKDLVERLGVASSTVTGALRALKERGLVNYAPYDLITLTPTGEGLARQVAQRHAALRDFFTRILQVEPAEAEEAACKMEHGVPRGILQRFTEFVKFVERCPRFDAVWTDWGVYRCAKAADDPEAQRDCEECVAQLLDELRSDKPRRDSTSGAKEASGDVS